MQAEGTGGEGKVGDSAATPVRLGYLRDLIANVNGRYFENNRYGRIFHGGMVALTSISAATFTVATTGATATPIAGVWNPLDSGVDAVILQAMLAAVLNALQATGCGGFAWMASLGNKDISTGAAPTSGKTLKQLGSACKDVSGVALTGMSGTLRAFRASALNGGSGGTVAFLATQVAMQTPAAPSFEEINGSIIVPPGGVLALMAASTPVGHSAISGLAWAEIPTGK